MNKFSSGGDDFPTIRIGKKQDQVLELRTEADYDKWQKSLESSEEAVVDSKPRYNYKIPLGDISRDILIDGIESSLRKNGFNEDDIDKLKSTIDSLEYAELRDKYNALMFEQHPSHFTAILFFDGKLPNPRINTDDSSYTFEQQRTDAKKMVESDFKSRFRGEELLNVVPIEKTHNKAVEIPDTKPGEPEKYHYHKVAVLSAVKNQDSPTGVTYVIRKGRAQGGVGFIENTNEPAFMTFNVDEAYSKLNEINYYPKENTRDQPTMKDWNAGGKEWEPIDRPLTKNKISDWVSDGGVE